MNLPENLPPPRDEFSIPMSFTFCVNQHRPDLEKSIAHNLTEAVMAMLAMPGSDSFTVRFNRERDPGSNMFGDFATVTFHIENAVRANCRRTESGYRIETVAPVRPTP